MNGSISKAKLENALHGPHKPGRRTSFLVKPVCILLPLLMVTAISWQAYLHMVVNSHVGGDTHGHLLKSAKPDSKRTATEDTRQSSRGGIVGNLRRQDGNTANASNPSNRLRSNLERRKTASQEEEAPPLPQGHPKGLGVSCGPSTSASVECKTVRAPTAKGTQCCCIFRPPKGRYDNSLASRVSDVLSSIWWEGTSKSYRFTCLPEAVVIGAQKSGSTALAGYLAMHPNVIPPRKKELHFFDSRAFRRKTMANYLDFLPPFPESVQSTMHDSNWVRRWNEYVQNVTVRKSQQTSSDDLSATLHQNVDKATNFITFEATPAYILGVPTPERMHAYIPAAKLLLILRDPVDRAYSEYQMKKRRVDRQRNDIEGQKTTGASEVNKCYKHLNGGLTPEKLADCLVKNTTLITSLRTRVNVERNFVRCFCKNERGMFSGLRSTANSCPRVPTAANVNRCLQPSHFRLEVIPPMDVLKQEADTIESKCLQADNTFLWGTSSCYPVGTNSNIVKDFVARGLYMAQIKHWLKYYSRDQLLVISDADLKEEPAKALNSVFQFVGVSELEEPLLKSKFTQEEVNSVLEQLYPSFTKTGWQLKSEYSPMPSDIEERLTAFYTPHNRELYEFLGRDLGWKRDSTRESVPLQFL
eukprot:gb/GECG01011539.1/.p1 GENE.gb/GECG01011539.1/~~gb/GECG01011539.1/.p1  ORF type:complete len:642 (+),score=57.98 gb/GECG01011539.1/:1-1926(+)